MDGLDSVPFIRQHWERSGRAAGTLCSDFNPALIGLAAGGECRMRVVSVLGIAAVTLIGDLASAQPNRIESISTPPSSALTEFWTTQRLNQAPAMPVPVVRLGTINRVRPAPIKPRAGAPKQVPGSVARASGNVYSRPLYFAGRLA